MEPTLLGTLLATNLEPIGGSLLLKGFSGFAKRSSLPEFLDFKLFGKTILVVDRKFELFLAHQLRK